MRTSLPVSLQAEEVYQLDPLFDSQSLENRYAFILGARNNRCLLPKPQPSVGTDFSYLNVL